MLMRIPLDDLEVMKGKGNSSSSVWINKIKETVALDSQRWKFEANGPRSRSSARRLRNVDPTSGAGIHVAQCEATIGGSDQGYAGPGAASISREERGAFTAGLSGINA